MFKIEGLGFRVQGFSFRVKGLRLGVEAAVVFLRADFLLRRRALVLVARGRDLF